MHNITAKIVKLYTYPIKYEFNSKINVDFVCLLNNSHRVGSKYNGFVN